MLGSLLSSEASSSDDQSILVPAQSSNLQLQLQYHHHPSTAIGMRELLISCADLLSKSDFSSASRLLSLLSSNSSPSGDSTQRLLHQFSKALSIRLNTHLHFTGRQLGLGVISSNYSTGVATTSTTSSLLFPSAHQAAKAAHDTVVHQSAYLTLNQITPFIRFIHLTSNQAILEAVDGESAIHILDFDIMHGVQWPPFMQAIAERCSHTLHPPPTLRITGTGPDLDVLHRTGDRLLMFAHSLGLRFQFHPLLIHNDAVPDLHQLHSSRLSGPGDEVLAVNCALYLHRLKKEDPHQHDIRLFLYKIKALKPKIVTVSEREANHNHPIFLHRFVEALDHYTSIFDSLEATLPPNSQERLILEQMWFGKEIADIVGGEGENRRERHERFESWEVMLRSCGFGNVALSPFALSQAKLLLRLHYPSEGYQFQVHHHCCFLGWQTRPLFSVSSWQ